MGPSPSLFRLSFVSSLAPPEVVQSPTAHTEPARNELLTPARAAAIAGRSVRTIRRAYTDGSLTAFRDGRGRSVRITYADLRAWMMSEELGGGHPQSPNGVGAVDHRALISAARGRQRSGHR